MSTKNKSTSPAPTISLLGREFGTVIESGGDGWYTKEVCEERVDVTVVVHIYEPQIHACSLLNRHLDSIAREWVNTKFVRLKSSLSGVHVDPNILPAISIYRAGKQLSVIKNFKELTEESGINFSREDVEW